MLKQTSSRFTIAVLLVAAVMLAAAGTSIASNMGFKLNKPLVVTAASGTPAQQGNNWVSIPYFNPYVNVTGLCTQLGLQIGGLITTRPTTTTLDPVTGNFGTAVCGVANPALVPGRAIRIRNPFNQTPVVNSVIIVGSHNPTLSITAPKGAAGQVGNNWFSVPYHTTAATFHDLCLSSGLTSTGLITGRASVTRLDAATGNFQSGVCGSTDTAALVLGEGVRLRDPSNPINFIPAHF
jgi:hypothetical protein